MPLRFLAWDGAADKVNGKHKVAVQRNGHFAASVARTGTLCWLTLQMTSNYTQGDQGRAQQHHRGTTVLPPLLCNFRALD
jgi:hypothetical protein